MKTIEAARVVVKVIEQRIAGKPYWYACTSSHLKPSFIQAKVTMNSNKMVLIFNEANVDRCNYFKCIKELLRWNHDIDIIIRNYNSDLSKEDILFLSEDPFMVEVMESNEWKVITGDK